MFAELLLLADGPCGKMGCLGKTAQSGISDKIEKNLTTRYPKNPKLLVTTGPVPGRRALPKAAVDSDHLGSTVAKVFWGGIDRGGIPGPSAVPADDAADGNRVDRRRRP
jgi:hypothetical protein